ncbi:hypothetical protein H5410_042056 [Solanum commersonii]|uniref:TACO1/YebC-like second and third domain-containing protein n=1 Tax=Solanum commersonii TaxID=4109 RepID=A0A9J5XXD6_SOLCO|nr:hypothetical protein H5410_042056 [Solanum commersonii]
MVYSSSSIRAFGSLLCRFSNGVHLKPHHSCTLRGVFLLSGNFSSSDIRVLPLELQYRNSVRKIWICSPLCMGRRSCKIAGSKGDGFDKIGCMNNKGTIQSMKSLTRVKKGGPSPISNTALAALIEKVKELDIPKDIVDRNVKRASEKGQEAFIEKIYEVYGYGGVGIIIEVLTDKVNRSVAAVREVVKDNGGKMADPGSIMFKFQRARVANVKVTDVDRDQLLTIALDAGAEDIIEPSMDEYDTEADSSESRVYKVMSSAENYPVILSKLQEEGIKFKPDNGSELLPTTPIEVDDEVMELNKELMSKLLELDDVDAVYTDQKY